MTEPSDQSPTRGSLLPRLKTALPLLVLGAILVAFGIFGIVGGFDDSSWAKTVNVIILVGFGAYLGIVLALGDRLL